MTVNLLVGLKIPDTTAITTSNILKNLEYDKVSRHDFYQFEIKGEIEKFKKEIVKVDILVNSNKNTAKVVDGLDDMNNSVIVTEKDDLCEDLIATLRRLGISEIKKMKRGVIWTFHTKKPESIKQATEELLYNKHYQNVEYI